MKTTYKILLMAAAGLMACQSSLFAQNSATTTGTANANVVIPIHLHWEHPLNFGVFTVPTGPVVLREGAPAVTINAGNQNNLNQPPTFVSGSGNTSLTNLAQFGAGNSGNPGPCIYLTQGAANAGYDITVPSASINVTGLVHSQNMTVDNFQAYITGAAVTSGTLDGSGNQYFAVGGDLHAATGQLADDYTGTFSVTVTYN